MGTLHAMGPSFLTRGSEVGPWRVVEWGGGGVYGLVYRVERIGLESAGPFALKMARSPQDPRFEREGQLLSLVHHPHVPQFHDRGEWQVQGGVSFPFLVMEWIDGVPLYPWAQAQPRSRAHLLRLLAQVARALEATHAVGGLHRDVKGGNILVRKESAEAVLVDFGTGTYRGASLLTRQVPPPGTPQYQSPESLRFEWEHLSWPLVRYEAQPADDVYALGMTAYRLLTGEYPPALMDVVRTGKARRFAHLPLVLPEQCKAESPELAALLHQMLSAEPAARDSAGEMAQALERAAETARHQEQDPHRHPAAPRVTARPASSAPPCPTLEASPERAAAPVSPRPSFAASIRLRTSLIPLHQRPGRVSWLAAAAAVAVAAVVLSAGVWSRQQHSQGQRSTAVARETQDRGTADAGTAELADSAVSTSVREASPEPARRGIGLEFPKNALPGQSRPPCVKPEVEINGGCWSGPTDEAPPCSARSYAWKNGCYRPILELPPPTTSDPSE
ncbi:serine/threonine-protein kinase [Hyalangium sp.]|uniref:serine/threonine protein kinase n=1 Tax=Hyalangium sp. TaxID=2028555 RepID=UPI002D2FEEBE|nr:serine/threonine-protein kinase [Hyalangium sp.]HYI02802.1 serine/threonine-protein kinase [Hyalangium sp.]